MGEERWIWRNHDINSVTWGKGKGCLNHHDSSDSRKKQPDSRYMFIVEPIGFNISMNLIVKHLL